LFSVSDGRSKLTWRNRFANLPKDKLYNYFSSGDEVFQVHPNTDLNGAPDLPGLEDFNSGKLLDIIHIGRYSWSLQEKLKGRMIVEGWTGSTYGGWGFNLNDYASGQWKDMPISASRANLLTDEQLRQKPFFKMRTADINLLDPVSGSQFALDNRDRLLAEAIPARTGAAGRNAIKKANMNSDMQANFIKSNNGIDLWPRRNDEKPYWLHSDMKEVSYLYIYSLFDDFIFKGGLKQ
jgi:hypothetical protein